MRCRFRRVTRLDAECTREQGLTVIRGSVSEGVPPRVQPYILVATVIVSLLLVLVTQIAAAVGVLAVGVLLYRMVRADWLNSDKLLLEIERALKASPKRPKAPEKAPSAAAAGNKKTRHAQKVITPVYWLYTLRCWTQSVVRCHGQLWPCLRMHRPTDARYPTFRAA